MSCLETPTDYTGSGNESTPGLVVMAAGMGSRFGGLKQMAPVGPSGEFLLDYAVFDAVRAGFGYVVFIVRESFEREFRESVGSRFASRIPVVYVRQEISDLPSPFVAAKGREKPWGTGHAVLCADSHVFGPFAVINADDFYGPSAFRSLARFFREHPDENALVGYRLRNTLSEFGGVSRGLCRSDESGRLLSVREATDIRRIPGGGCEGFVDGRPVALTGDETVSMNMWGLRPSIFGPMRERFREFLALCGDDPKAEFYLPEAIGASIAGGTTSAGDAPGVWVRLLRSEEEWFGMTYAQDREGVAERLRQMVRRGVYPNRLAQPIGHQAAVGMKNLPRKSVESETIPGPVVFMPHYHEAIRTFQPIVEALKAEGYAVLMLLDARDGESPSLCDGLGMPWEAIPPFAWGRRLHGGPVKFVREAFKARRFAHGFFCRVRPSALVMTDDRRYVESFLIRRARENGVPSLVVMWATTNRSDIMRQWRRKAAYNDPGRSPIQRLKHRLMVEAAKRLAPQAVVREADGLRLLWQPVNAICAIRLFGCYPPHPWLFGGGCADRVTAIGPHYQRMMAAHGIPESKILVTGHPRHDALYRNADRWKNEARADIRREIGAPPEKRLVLLGTPPVAHIIQGTRAGHVTPDRMRAYLRRVVADLLLLREPYHLVVKLHPRDAGMEAPYLEGHERPVTVVRHGDISRIIAISDLLVCQGSTIVFDAHILDTRVVTFDFYDTPGYDMWHLAGGVRHVTDPTAFLPSVREVLVDEAVRSELAAARNRFMADYVRCDGRATERIADWITTAIGKK